MSVSTKPSTYIQNLAHTPSDQVNAIKSDRFVNCLEKTYGEDTVKKTYGWIFNRPNHFQGEEAFKGRTYQAFIDNSEINGDDQKYIANLVQLISVGQIQL